MTTQRARLDIELEEKAAPQPESLTVKTVLIGPVRSGKSAILYFRD